MFLCSVTLASFLPILPAPSQVGLSFSPALASMLFHFFHLFTSSFLTLPWPDPRGLKSSPLSPGLHAASFLGPFHALFSAVILPTEQFCSLSAQMETIGSRLTWKWGFLGDHSILRCLISNFLLPQQNPLPHALSTDHFQSETVSFDPQNWQKIKGQCRESLVRFNWFNLTSRYCMNFVYLWNYNKYRCYVTFWFFFTYKGKNGQSVNPPGTLTI